MQIKATDRITHTAAWLYYRHGLNQDEVARRLDISRASVANYLRRARETGIVTISTSTQLFADDTLARQLEDAVGLQAAWIVPEDRHVLDPAHEIPMVAGAVFLELINKGDRVGVAWGRTVYHIAEFDALRGPARRHRRAIVRKSRRALLLSAGSMHDRNRAATERRRRQSLRASRTHF